MKGAPGLLDGEVQHPPRAESIAMNTYRTRNEEKVASDDGLRMIPHKASNAGRNFRVDYPFPDTCGQFVERLEYLFQRQLVRDPPLAHVGFFTGHPANQPAEVIRQRRPDRKGRLVCRQILRKDPRHRESCASRSPPHMCRLCHVSGGELEQVQFLLAHVSVQTTERYLGCKQKIRNAVNDGIGIEPAD